MSQPLNETPKGVVLKVKAIPKAGRNEIGDVRAGRLVVRVTAAPEDNKANQAVIKLLSKRLGIPAARFELTSGATSRDKTLLIHGAVIADLPDEIAGA